MKNTLKNCSLVVLALLVSRSAVYAVETAPTHPIDAQTYHFSVSGTILSGGLPSAGTQVTLELQSTGTRRSEALALVKEDGRYFVQAPILEFAEGAVNWKLTIHDTKGAEDKIFEGSCILDDKHTIALERSVGADQNVEVASAH